MEFGWQKKNYNYDKRLNKDFPEMEEDFNYRNDQEYAICGTIDMLAYNTH